ncbi:GH25 family lysozyme [Paracoccus pacificus]|uniref:GH25 family lysozyme n=1 Tax=Paracoccus pacificus TaxID=1463598 RepID=A0ABW4RDB1_9RHOB
MLFVAACGRSPARVSGGPGGYVGGAVPQISDSKPHVWVGGHPYNNQVHGIDVSKYQGNIDWNRAREAGVSFAFIKATEGGDHRDTSFPRYYAEAAAAGIPRGAYHYFYFCRSAQEQAAWFIANVPRQRGALPPVLDAEWTPTSRTCRTRPSPAEVQRELNTWLTIIERYYGQRPIVYTTVDFYRHNNLGQLQAEFWLRSVAGHPSKVYPGQRWTFWQYSGTGIVPGIRGNVDLNTFVGDAQTWRSWFQRRSQ